MLTYIICPASNEAAFTHSSSHVNILNVNDPAFHQLIQQVGICPFCPCLYFVSSVNQNYLNFKLIRWSNMLIWYGKIWTNYQVVSNSNTLKKGNMINKLWINSNTTELLVSPVVTWTWNSSVSIYVLSER